MGDELLIGVGADSSGAVTAFDGLTESVDKFNVRMAGLSETFAKPLENVGVKLFGHELLNTMGIAGEARPVLVLMKLGVTEVTEAMGIGAGAAAMYTFGLTALAAIAYKAYEAHEKHAQSLGASIKELTSAYEKTEEVNTQFDKYHSVVETMPGSLGRWEEASRNLASAQKDLLITELNLQLVALQPELDKTASWFNAVSEKAILAGYDLSKFGIESDGTKKLTGDMAVEVEKAWVEYQKLSEQVQHTKADLESYKTTGMSAADATKKGTEEAEGLSEAYDMLAKNYDAAQKMNAKLAGEEQKAFASMRADQQKYFLELDKQQDQANTKMRSFFGLAKDQATEYKMIGSQAFQGVANAVGTSVAKMVIEQKNFADTAKALFMEVAEQAIARLIAVEIIDRGIEAGRAALHMGTETAITADATAAGTARHTANQVTNILMAQSYAGVAEAAAAASAAILGPEASLAAVSAEAAIVEPAVALAAAATGADFIADQPTRLLVGEGGQGERVTVTPLSQAPGQGGVGGGSPVYISIENIALPGVKNARDFVEQITMLVAQRIRGRGEINMVGKGIY